MVADLLAGPGLDLPITGTTADGHTRYPSLPDLGKARAEAVKDLVLAMSEGQITATRITTIGKGYTATPPQVDVVTAALNRSVTLTYSN